MERLRDYIHLTPDEEAALEHLEGRWGTTPYYVFHCEPAPGIDHFRTPLLKGAELIRDGLRGHTTGLATPLYCVATHIGKLLLMPDYAISGEDDDELRLVNYRGETTTLPQIREYNGHDETME